MLHQQALTLCPTNDPRLQASTFHSVSSCDPFDRLPVIHIKCSQLK